MENSLAIDLTSFHPGHCFLFFRMEEYDDYFLHVWRIFLNRFLVLQLFNCIVNTIEIKCVLLHFMHLVVLNRLLLIYWFLDNNVEDILFGMQTLMTLKLRHKPANSNMIACTWKAEGFVAGLKCAFLVYSDYLV